MKDCCSPSPSADLDRKIETAPPVRPETAACCASTVCDSESAITAATGVAPAAHFAGDDCCAAKGDEIAALGAHADVRRVLILVLAINLAMFFAEFGAGLFARSTALMADSVDMLGDALV